MRQLLETPEGQARLAEGRMKLAGAVYEIESGRVRFLASGRKFAPQVTRPICPSRCASEPPLVRLRAVQRLQLGETVQRFGQRLQQPDPVQLWVRGLVGQ